MEALQAAHAEAQKSLEASIADRAAKQEEAKAAAARVKKAQEEYHHAEVSTRSSLKAWTELRESRAKIAAVIGGPLSMLVDGGWEDDAAREAAMEAVTDCLTEVAVDRALVAAVPPAFALKPDSRTAFDNVVVTSVKEMLGPRLEALEKQVEADIEAQKNVEAEILGLWAIMDVAKESASAASLAAKAAERAVRAAEAAAESASAQVLEEEARLAEQAKNTAEAAACGAEPSSAGASLAPEEATAESKEA